MRRRLILGVLALAVIAAGIVSLAAFTAQVVNLTAHVEKDIAVEPVICSSPRDINTPCFVDPRGGNFGVVLPQEFYDRIIEVTLSNSFFEQDRYDDLSFDILWECKNVNEDANSDPANGVLCREDIADDSICPIDLDVPPDGKADTVRHCDPLKLDGNIRDHITVTEFLNPARCLTDDPGVAGTNNPPNTPRPTIKKVGYVGTGFLDKTDHKCRYELKLFAPPCEGSLNPFTDPRINFVKSTVVCHLADKDRDGVPSLRNPQDFDEFADLGDDFKIQVWAHSFQPCGGILDICVDADGFATAGSGLPAAADVTEGSALTSFGLCPQPTPTTRTYVDMFDNDSSGTWTAGDDLHVEDPALGGIADAFHDVPEDPVILDINGSLFDGQPVDVDLDGFLGTLPSPPLRYHDKNGDGCWDSGEDIVLDVNNNSVFD